MFHNISGNNSAMLHDSVSIAHLVDRFVEYVNFERIVEVDNSLHRIDFRLYAQYFACFEVAE